MGAGENTTESPERTSAAGWMQVPYGWITGLVAYFSAYILLFQKYHDFAKMLETSGVGNTYAQAGIAAFPALVAAVYGGSNVVRRRRRQKLIDEGIHGQFKNPGYFRLRPYEAEDSESFSRADGAHEEVRRWILRRPAPILYLSGRSGTGKTSLLQSWVIPKLCKNEAYCTVTVRGYDNPLINLADALVAPNVIWAEPPTDTKDPHQLLERACQYLKTRRLLVIFDQFEEFLILQAQTMGEELRSFLQSILNKPIDNLTFLIVFRSDYDALLSAFTVGSVILDENYKIVPPFTERACLEFLDQSGLELGEQLKTKILQEALEIEETKGLVRPITINMFGILLSRFNGQLPSGISAGSIIRDYIRATLREPGIREHVAKILPPMITPAATKRPRSIEELAAATGLSPNLIRGTLLHLGNEGLVRPLDRKQNAWEVSHDFLARILNNVLAGWRAALMQNVRPWVLPASVVVWALALLLFVQWGRAHHDDRLRQSIVAKGYKISETAPGSDFVDACDFDGDEKLFDYLKQLPSVKGLRLCAYSTEGWAGLTTNPEAEKSLGGLFRTAKSMLEARPNIPLDQQIGTASIQVSERNVWGEVLRYQRVRIFSQALGDHCLGRVGELTQLETVEVKGSAVHSLNFIAPLSKLKTLTLADTRVDDLTELVRHPLLSKLNITGGAEEQVKAVQTIESELPGGLSINVEGAQYFRSSPKPKPRGLTPEQMQQVLRPASDAKPIDPKSKPRALTPEQMQQVLRPASDAKPINPQKPD